MDKPLKTLDDSYRGGIVNDAISKGYSDRNSSNRGNHTPGPWRHATKGNFGNMVEAQSGKRTYEADDGWRGVAMVQHCCPSSNYMDEARNQAANIALIAAAPDLLAAHVENARVLRFLVGELQGRVEGGKLAVIANCLARSSDSIAKATGKT